MDAAVHPALLVGVCQDTILCQCPLRTLLFARLTRPLRGSICYLALYLLSIIAQLLAKGERNLLDKPLGGP